MKSPVLKHGIDMIEIERVKLAVGRHGERFLNRVYTPAELAESGVMINSLAVRFAAKEAVAKALGTGIGEIRWCEIEICRAESGEPQLNLYGRAANIADRQGLKAWAVSLSHTRTQAIASVVALG